MIRPVSTIRYQIKIEVPFGFIIIRSLRHRFASNRCHWCLGTNKYWCRNADPSNKTSWFSTGQKWLKIKKVLDFYLIANGIFIRFVCRLFRIDAHFTLTPSICQYFICSCVRAVWPSSYWDRSKTHNSQTSRRRTWLDPSSVGEVQPLDT